MLLHAPIFACCTRASLAAIELVAERLSGIKNKILVLSGKGGVGKSTFSSQLAFTLAARGRSVGLLDVDICGPSIPQMTGLREQKVHQSATGWSPVWLDENMGVMSIGFMLPDQDDAIIWRGPRKNGLIRQFLTDVEWGTLDYLIIDTPPGTSDEHISTVQFLKGCFPASAHKAGSADPVGDGTLKGAVVVTTPQEVAMADVRKELSFCTKTALPVLGVVANMDGYMCPCCGQVTKIFKSGGGRKNGVTHAHEAAAAAQAEEPLAGPQLMAAKFGAPFLGSLPLDPALLQCCEDGVGYVVSQPGAPGVRPLLAIVDQLIRAVEGADAQLQPIEGIEE